MLLIRWTYRRASILGAFLAIGFILSSFLLWAPVASAQSNSSIAQSFTSGDPDMASGSLASLQKGSVSTVDLSNTTNVTKLVGVVCANPDIDFSSGTAQTTQIVTSGITPTLVSSINGTINYGDKITASPIDGIGMKATQSTQVVGIAEANLSSVSTQTKTIVEKSGQTETVHIGVLPVQVGVTYYSLPTDTNTYVPQFAQQLAKNVAGHNVSTLRIITASVLLVLIFVSVVVILYSAVRSSLVAIGRNPLSERAVRKVLIEDGLAMVVIIAFACLGIYLLLVT